MKSSRGGKTSGMPVVANNKCQQSGKKVCLKKSKTLIAVFFF